MTIRSKAVAVSAVGALLLTGCGPVVNGLAVRERPYQRGDAIRELLDSGNYPTEPSKPMGTGGPDGSVLEGQRMAEFVVGPWEVDPALLNFAYDTTLVWRNADALKVTMAAPAPEIAAKHDFLAGFVSGRSTEGPRGESRSLANGVLRFGSEADAAAAAAEMGAPAPPADFVSARTPLPLPGHPDAVAVAGTLDDGTAVVESFTPHGIYVLYDYATVPGGDRDAAVELVAAAIDLQAGRIDKFWPTNPAKFADLRIDWSGLLARTLPPAKGEATIRNGSWGPRAALHFSVNPVESAKAFAAGELQEKTYGKSMVFASPNPDAAERLFDAFFADPSPGEKPAEGVSGLPSARCTSDDTDPLQPLFTCTLMVDRYVAVTASSQAADARQQAAAQYLMLTAP